MMLTRASSAADDAEEGLEDAQTQMEQAEDFLALIMDARAEQDAAHVSEQVAAVKELKAQAGDHDDAHSSSSPTAAAVAAEVQTEANAEEEEDEKEDEQMTPRSRADPKAPTLSLALLERDGRQVQWDLISPWSEADEERVDDDNDNDDDSESAGATAATPAEPEPEPELQIEERLRELIKSESASALVSDVGDALRAWDVDADDDDDEEFEVFSVRPLLRMVESIDEELHEPPQRAADDGGCRPDDARPSVASTLDDSSEESPRPSAAARARSLGRRLRAQSYTGSAATSVQSALAKLRSRTLSSTGSAASAGANGGSSASSSELEDAAGERAGSFCQQDADSAGRGSRGSFSRYALASRLGSVGSLKMATGRMSFLRFRSSSATTTTSEDSFYADSASPVDKGDVHSAPSFLSTLEPPPPPLDTSGGGATSSNPRQMHALKLKASAAASKAAGYLNAASSEAARKLKKSRPVCHPTRPGDDDEPRDATRSDGRPPDRVLIGA